MLLITSMICFQMVGICGIFRSIHTLTKEMIQIREREREELSENLSCCCLSIMAVLSVIAFLGNESNS